MDTIAPVSRPRPEPLKGRRDSTVPLSTPAPGALSWVSRLMLVTTTIVMVLASVAVMPRPAEAASYQATANLNIRSGPGTDFPVVGGIPEGATVEVAGEAVNGFLPVSYNGVAGYASASWLSPGNGGGAGSGPTGTRYAEGRVNMRSGPGASYGIVLVVPDGAAVQLTGEVSADFSQVTWNGTSGWIATWLLSPDAPTAPGPTATPVTPTAAPVTPTSTPVIPSAPEVPAIGDTVVGSATANTGGLALNLRSGPGTAYAVLRGIPNGTRVDVMGDAVNGFLPVRYSGVKGWASAQYLTMGASAATPTPTVTPTPTGTPATPTPTSTPVTPEPTGTSAASGTAVVTTGGLNLYLRSGPSTTASVLRTMPNGAQVEVTGSDQNGFTPVRYQGTAGWASAQYLGVTPSPTATPVTPTPSPGPSPTSSPTPSPTPTSTPVPTVPGGSPVATAVVSVSGANLNMRSGPGTNYAVIRGLASGVQVDVMGDAVNGFLPIRVQGTSGWAHQDYLIIGGVNPNPTVPAIGNTAVGKATINATVWKRTGPGATYSANEQLPAGRKVEIMGDAFNGWTPIRYNGSKGWVPSSYLDPGWGWTIVDQMVTTRIIPMTTAPGGGSVVINVGSGSLIDITGPANGRYYPVQWYGRLGWVDGSTLIPLNQYVDPGPRNQREADMIAIVYEFADKWGISRDTFLRVARCESSLNPNAVSNQGAQGLFQFMPGTWAWTPNGRNGEDPFNPRSSADAAGWMFANGMAHHWMCA